MQDSSPPKTTSSALPAGISPDEIRTQLDRLTSHPVFRNSRRCQQLLTYLVEYTLQGEAAPPKERALGAEVFGREPGYDTADDPVVRSAAGGIRKRLAQYYNEPGHEDQLHIGLHVGSYLLEFHQPLAAHAPDDATARLQEQLPRRPYFRWLALAALLLAGLLGGVAWLTRPAPAGNFWQPVLHSNAPVTICVPLASSYASSFPEDGADADSADRAASNLSPVAPVTSPLGLPFVTLTDNEALLKITRFFTQHKVDYRVRYGTFHQKLSEMEKLSGKSVSPPFTELRDGPMVFVGNSDWTLEGIGWTRHLMEHMRFHSRTDPATGRLWIEDTQHPNSLLWSIPSGLRYDEYTVDYALISRIYDPATGHTVIFMGGLGFYGTRGAAEFVTNSGYMQQFLASHAAEKDRNVQVVISCAIVGEAEGKPQVVATFFN